MGMVFVVLTYYEPPLHAAALRGDLPRVRELLAYGAPVDEEEQPSGTTALFKAAFSGHIDVMEELMKHGADINHKDCNGWTPLHDARSGGQQDAVKFLIQRGALE